MIASISMLLLVLIVVAVMMELSPPVWSRLRPNPYKASDFGYQDGYLTCLSGESLLGIDVSHHQGDIDWQKVADSPVKFAMIRLGNRTAGDGALMEDRYGKINLSQARQAGLSVGVYFYSQAVSVAEAREEAQYLLRLLDGAKLDMPVVFDWEIFSATGRTANVDGDTVTACAVAFCEMVQNAGYQPMVYYNKDIADRLLDLELMQKQGCRFWYARYNDSKPANHWVDMWQYTDSGRVPGIEVNVDLNLYFPSK